MSASTTARRAARWFTLAVAAILVPLVGAPAHAGTEAAQRTRFTETDLVSDQAGKAQLLDPLLVNAWGLALSPTSPLWVADNGTNSSTLYRGSTAAAPAVTKAPLDVSIPGGAPTGQAFNDTTGFVVTGPGGAGPAAFIFVSEGGDITGWNPTADRTHAILVKHVDGAVYKGLALLHTDRGALLLAANFAQARVDVFDSMFNRVKLPASRFRDRRLPAGYAPFNVMADGNAVYVAYAKQGEGIDEQAGAGFGFVDRYTGLGREPERIASRGTLNAPWGLAIAPASFGRFAGDLLVGNFGDGRISAFHDDDVAGLLRGTDGTPIVIDGLWALLPGTATVGGTDSVLFSAGPDDESHGLVGKLTPAG